MMIVPNHSFSNVSIEAGFYQTDIGIYYQTDLILTSSGSSQIFWVHLNNDAAPRKLALLIEIANKSGLKILSVRTKFFAMSPYENCFLTNIDLTNPNSPYGLERREWHEKTIDFQRNLKATGHLPSDEYLFKFTLINKSGDVLSQTEEQLSITNPTNVDLIAPGGPLSIEAPEILSKFPMFQWESTGHRFILTVCEKQSVNATPEDVMNNEPHLRIETNKTSYQYPLMPQFGARPLTEGHIYCWQVKALVRTSSGEEEAESEIWEFRLANFSHKPGIEVNFKLSEKQQRIIITLKQLLGEHGLRTWLDDFMQKYPDYKPTGEILIDGKKISCSELAKLIKKLRSDGFEILKVEMK